MAIIASERGGNPTWECDDCGRWEYQDNGRYIKHSSRCDCADEQPGQSLTETSESAAERRARIRRGEWSTAAEVYNDFGDGELTGRILLDTDY